jgi:hypothetical protein
MAPEPMPRFSTLEELKEFLEGVERFQWIKDGELFDFDRAGVADPPAHCWFMRCHPTNDYYWNENTSNVVLFPKLLAVLNAGITVNYLCRRQ